MLLTLLACTAIGLVLRLYNLDGRPLWIDEAGTWGYASLDVSSLVGVMGRVELTPPGYYLLIKAWMALGDASEFWLRLSSVLVSAAAIPLFGLFLWRAVGPVPAMWGAALLTIAGAHVRYAQEARVYSIVFTLFVLGLLCMERLVAALEAARPGWRRWGFAAGLAAVTGAMIHLHFSTVFAAATLYVYGLCLLLARRSASVGRVAVLVASGLGGLVLAAPVLWLAVGIASDTRGAAYWMPIPDLAQAFLEFRSVLFAPHLQRLAVAAVALSLPALGVCLWLGRREPHVQALAVSFAFAACGFYAVSQVTPILMDRTVLFTLALVLAILAYGLSRIRKPWLLAAVAAAVLLPQIKGTANQLASAHFYGELWEDTAAHIDRAAGPRDTIMPIGAFEALALDYYLMREGDLRSVAAVGDREGAVNTLAIALMTEATPITVPELEGPICGALRPGSDIWLVSRVAATYTELVVAVASSLRASGSEMRSRTLHGNVFVEHWSPPSRCG